MVIKISKKASCEEIQLALKKIANLPAGRQGKKAKGGFEAKKYFGKLVRNLDGLEYQKTARLYQPFKLLTSNF